MDPHTEATASRAKVVEGRLVRLSQGDHRTALSEDHSRVGLGKNVGQGRRSKWGVRLVWLYQICYLTNYREGKPLACIKDYPDCARRRIPSG